MPEAARLLRFQCTRTVYRLADAGLIRLRETAGGRVIARKELEHAPVLTVSQVAKRAGCSVRTVRRRVEAGLVDPHREWGRAARYSLADVRKIRASRGARKN